MQALGIGLGRRTGVGVPMFTVKKLLKVSVVPEYNLDFGHVSH